MLMLSVDTMPRHCALLLLTLNMGARSALLRTIFSKSHQFYLLINIATFIRYEGVPQSHSNVLNVLPCGIHIHTFTKRGRSCIADLLFMCTSIEPIMGVAVYVMLYPTKCILLFINCQKILGVTFKSVRTTHRRHPTNQFYVVLLILL